jgi:hypothetical protein
MPDDGITQRQKSPSQGAKASNKDTVVMTTNLPLQAIEKYGGYGWIRTTDTGIMSAVL